MLKNILNTISNNKKTIFYFIVFFVAFFALFDLASASTGLSPSETRFNEMKQTASVVVEFFIKIITVFLSLITFLVALFLSPEWYNGSIFGMNLYFKDIWIIVSNFVYFVFAFILIWIAFMNIIGKGQDKYALKQALPKFIVGIFIVPISWFLVQFTLSVVSVLSIAALNLPFDTFKSFENDVNKINLQTNCILNLSDISNQSATENQNQSLKFFDCPDGEKTLGSFLDSKAFTDSIFGVIGVYTYGILDLKTVSTLTASYINGIKTIGDLVVKILFDLLFIIIYSILMIALGLVLFTRGIYLWFYIMISPVFGLMYFFGKSDGGSGFFEKFNVKEFLSLAMVPVYTMLALSLGLLFLYVIGQGVSSDGTDYQSNFFRITPSNDGSSTTLTIGEDSAKLTILGGLDPSNESSFLKDIGNGSLGVVGTLIMKIFGVVVLWMAVMAALSSSKITKEIIKPLKDFGDQVGSLASKVPQYAPIFGGQSMTSLSQIGSTAKSHYENQARERGTNFLKDNGLFGQNAQTESKAANALSELKNTQGLNNSSVTRFSEALHEFQNSQQAANSDSMVQASKLLAEKLGIGEEYYNNINGNRDNFSRLMSMIDAKLDEGGNAYGNLFTDRNRNINHAEFDSVALDNYLSQRNNQQQQTQTPATPTTGNQTINLNIGTTTPASINIGTSSNLNDIYGQLSNLDFNNITEIDFRSNLLSILNSNNVTNPDTIADGVLDKLKNEGGKVFKTTP